MSELFAQRFRVYRRSLQFKIMVGALALSLAAIWSVVFYATNVFLRDQESVVKEQQLSMSRHNAAEVNQKLQGLLEYVITVARHIDTSRISDGNYSEEFLSRLYALRQNFTGGTIVYAVDGTATGDYPVVPGRRGTNYADRAYFKKAMETGKPFITPPFAARSSGRPIVAICVPLIGPANERRGLITASIELSSPGFLGLLSDSKLMGSQEFYLLSDRERLIIASTDQSRVMKKLPDSGLSRRLTDAVSESFVDVSAKGVEKIYSASSVGDTGWSLVIATPTEIAFGPINRMMYALLMTGLVLTVFCVVGASWISTRLMGQLRDVAYRMDSMSSGKHPLHQLPETGETEVRGLLHSFNRLTGSVVQQQALLISERNELSDAKKSLKELNFHLEEKVAARTAALTTANKELEIYTSAISHDLQSPVRAINGYVSILISEFGSQFTGEAKRFLEQIRHAAVRMSGMIDAMLALTRSTRNELKREKLDISAMSATLLEELASLEPTRNVTWHIEAGLQTAGDKRSIESVLSNLLGNAWKYTGKTTAPVIRVATGVVGDLHGICVSDNGTGFDIAHSEKLFEPFHRLHHESEFPGTGMGLATVKRILDRHHGEIRVESAPGVGTTFCFSLPHGSSQQLVGPSDEGNASALRHSA